MGPSPVFVFLSYAVVSDWPLQLTQSATTSGELNRAWVASWWLSVTLPLVLRENADELNLEKKIYDSRIAERIATIPERLGSFLSAVLPSTVQWFTLDSTSRYTAYRCFLSSEDSLKGRRTF